MIAVQKALDGAASHGSRHGDDPMAKGAAVDEQRVCLKAPPRE
jgi:hypothetical protein